MICTKEEMIERVKDCGQELIDNAKNIVNDFKYGTDITINCYIDWHNDEDTPRISIENNIFPERFVERYSGK